MGTGIYKITNIINGKCYVGSAVDFARRWKKHKKALNEENHHSRHLTSAWRKYGERCFEFSIIEEITDIKKLKEREQYYLDTLEPEYNILKDAGFSRIGTKHTEETKRKMSESATGKLKSKLTRKRMSKAKKGCTPWNKGKTLPEEYKQKIRMTLRGCKLSEEHIKNSANGHKGIKYKRR